MLRTLQVCTRASKLSARVELAWSIGFAFIPLFIVAMVVVYSRPLADMPFEVFDVIGRGELMVYAAIVCGATLYALRHNIEGPLPEVIRQRSTPLGTLTTLTVSCMAIALSSYVVRRMGDIHHIPLNEFLVNLLSVLVLTFSISISYVVLSLKHALNSGAAPASHEQTEDFSKAWEAERNA